MVDRGSLATRRIMEKKMETTIVYWGYREHNGKENGNYYSISVL